MFLKVFLAKEKGDLLKRDRLLMKKNSLSSY